ncbi:MAG: FIG00684496: hypothetical protein, partial [uncultured Blastococcus sp.]
GHRRAHRRHRAGRPVHRRHPVPDPDGHRRGGHHRRRCPGSPHPGPRRARLPGHAGTAEEAAQRGGTHPDRGPGAGRRRL